MRIYSRFHKTSDSTAMQPLDNKLNFSAAQITIITYYYFVDKKIHWFVKLKNTGINR